MNCIRCNVETNRHGNVKCCLDCVKVKKKEQHNKYYQEHKEERKEYNDKYYQKNKKKLKEKHKEYMYKYNREHKKERLKYNEKHNRLLEVKQRRNKQLKERKNTDPLFKLMFYIRTDIYMRIKRKSNGHIKRKDIVPYTIEVLKESLERKFTNEMNWHNRGKYWHLDHIIPLSYFVKRYKETNNIGYLKEAWKLKNLQPLEKIENLSKNDTITPEIQERINLIVIKSKGL